jgi:hypothetical protein
MEGSYCDLYFSSGITLLLKSQEEADPDSDLFHPGHALACRFAGGQTEAMAYLNPIGSWTHRCSVLKQESAKPDTDYDYDLIECSTMQRFTCH